MIALFASSIIWIVWIVLIDYNLIFGCIADFLIVILFQKEGITVLINQPEEGKFDIMITDIKAKFKLAPDLFIERTDTSVLGGIFQKGKEKIIKKPKNLTQEELTAILEMYKMVSFKVLCDVFGIKVSIPKFN